MSDILKHSDFKDGKATKLIKIENIPEGYEHYFNHKGTYFFKQDKKPDVTITTPITPGPHTFMCECGGVKFCLGCDCYHYDNHHCMCTSCLDYLVCPSCQDRPEIKAAINIEVIKKDNSHYFGITGREVL